ncbi:MAG: DUF58 domain-containing protein [Bdellovibrionaceae bacterium]|nr:DUF58 domain-containing protein [Pseudobdellovibrionaceae bacterium]
MDRNGKIYILPTRFGVVFFIGIVLMLLVGATYSNNLVNMLAFFLLAIAFVAMVQTHNNLKNIKLQKVSVEPGFAGSTVSLTTALENTGTAPRFNLEVRAQKMKFDREPENAQPLQARATLRFKSEYFAETRGRYPLKRLKISTIFPVGLFYSWMWIPTDETYLVYPQPKGDQPLPSTKLESFAGPHALTTRGGDDFYGHREYRPGDPARRIDWKAFARGRPLLVKEFDEGDPAAVVFDYDQLQGMTQEARLSQLAAWVESAKQQRLSYALRLPHVVVPAGDDYQHYLRCLEQLALFPAEPTSPSDKIRGERTRGRLSP